LKNKAFATFVPFGSSDPVTFPTPDVKTTVRAKIGQLGQSSLASAPTWFSGDAGGTLSQDWGDFNGDGQLDLVLGSSLGASVYVNQNGQLKLYWKEPTNNRRAYGVRWADFNHDGKLEIVAVGDSVDGSAVTSGTNYIYGQAAGGFAPIVTFVSDYQMVRVAVGKFSGTNNIDIIASTNTLNADCPVRLFRNDGSGGFSGPGECVSHDATAALGPGDFDNNGTLDLAVGLFPNVIEILRNNGSGYFTTTAPVIVDNNVPFLPYDFAWGDYDSNGLLDLAAAFPLQKEARVYRNLAAVCSMRPWRPSAQRNSCHRWRWPGAISTAMAPWTWPWPTKPPRSISISRAPSTNPIRWRPARSLARYGACAPNRLIPAATRSSAFPTATRPACY